mgnify:FL=1
MTARTKEEVERSIGKTVKEIPTNLAEGIISNAEFQKTLNRYMLKTHVVWGAFMAATIVGLWNVIAALQIPLMISGVASLAIGLIGIGWQVLVNKPNGKLRRASDANQNKD